MATPPIPHEWLEQKSVAQWLDWQVGPRQWFHYPSEFFTSGKRDGKFFGQIAKLKAAGWKPGIADIIVIKPPPKVLLAPGAVIELKRIKGGRVDANQAEWLTSFAKLGWATAVCEGADKAIAQLTEWGY